MKKVLQLSNLVSPRKAYAQIGHTSGLIALQRIDHQAGRAKPHEPAVMHPTAVILLQNARVSVSAWATSASRRTVYTPHGETGQGAPVLRQASSQRRVAYGSRHR